MSPPMPVLHGSVMFRPAAIFQQRRVCSRQFDLCMCKKATTACQMGTPGLSCDLPTATAASYTLHKQNRMEARGFEGGEGLTTQFPPASSTSIPHLAASGCVHATMPRVLWTTLRRLGNLASSREGGGKTESETASGILFLSASAFDTIWCVAKVGVGGRRWGGCK